MMGSMPTPHDPVITSSAGSVRGRRLDDGVERFLGLTYAQPPVGPLRFQPPVSPAPRDDVVDAGRYGPTAPQSLPAGPLGQLLPRAIIDGQDYLNLNIWTPPSPSSASPVMVFVHGGSWTSGSGSVGGYDGARFARDGIVLVTVNYRLGADGFAWFGEGPANLGLLDIICALEWVRDNIEAFGGDPTNVTLVGESSGAMSIGALLAMPSAHSLFHRAILESGSTAHTIDADSARKVATRLASLLNVAPSRAGLASAPIAALLSAQERLSAEVSNRPSRSRWGDVAANGLAFEPVVDGTTLPTRPLEALQAGTAADVDLLIGWNTEEANLVLAPRGLATVRPWMLYVMAAKTGLPLRHGARTYRSAAGTGGAGKALGAMLTDWIYRIPAIRTAEATTRAHVYEFAWRSPALDGQLGACHGVELPFVFDNLDHPDWSELLGDNPPHRLAREVHEAWTSFARTGDPGWTPYTPERRTIRHFDTESSTLTDPNHTRRAIWAGRR